MGRIAREHVVQAEHGIWFLDGKNMKKIFRDC
jgi:hypothetical protein